jgi:hypothetical protein
MRVPSSMRISISGAWVRRTRPIRLFMLFQPSERLAAEQAVAPVRRLIRKIELRREHPPLRRLHFDV